MSKRPAAQAAPATQEEIDEALKALTPAQLVRLNELSAYRHRSLGTRGAGRHEGDLLSDAIRLALTGRRKWIKANVDIMTFLAGVMRSCASHIRTGKAIDAFDEIAPNPTNEADEEDFVEQMPTTAPVDPERQLLARDLDERIRERFKADPAVLLVYDGFQEKMTPAEIRACLDMSTKDFDTTAKRLRRAARELAKGGPR